MLTLCCAVQPAWAQQAKPATNNKAADPTMVTGLIKTNDNFQVQQAIQVAVQMLDDEKSSKSAAEELPIWLKTLLSQKRLDEVEELASAAIASQPTSLPLVENCQKLRVRACLVAGKPKDALALAKGLYNVCAMANTAQAIDVICECLYDVNKDNDPAAVVKNYKLQQIHGAAPVENTAAATPTEKSMLADVKVDAKVYEKAIETCELNADGFAGLIGKGNLYLLADQPKEAKKAFEKAYTLAADKNLGPASEAVARAMRAEDGTVGRANAWILALRPSEGGQ